MAGSGADGQVRITYTVTGTLAAALQPAAGADAGANAFAAGYTGPVAAIQPASSPSVVETWHAITLDRLVRGVPVQLPPVESACIDFQLANAGTTGNVTVMTLPAAYWPATAHAAPFILPRRSRRPDTIGSPSTPWPVVTSGLPSSTTTSPRPSLPARLGGSIGH